MGWVLYLFPDNIIVISSQIICLNTTVMLAIKLLITIASCRLTTDITQVVYLAKVWILILFINAAIIWLSIRVWLWNDKLIALHCPLRIVVIILFWILYLTIYIVARILCSSFVILIIIQGKCNLFIVLGLRFVGV